MRSAPAFGAGDVIGVELRIEGGRGSVRFYKNDVEATAQQATEDVLGDAEDRRDPGGGLRPACHVGGAGDALIWRGCKRGRSVRSYAPEGCEDCDGARSYEGGYDARTRAPRA